MAYKCDLCGKGKIITKMGRHHRGVAGGKWKHRAQKTRKVLFPNLHSYKGILKGVKGRWKLCTKCLRIVKNQAKEIREKAKIAKDIQKIPAPNLSERRLA